MNKYAFYKNTLSLLNVIRSGSFRWLIDEAWLSEAEVMKMVSVLGKLDYAKWIDDERVVISEKGLMVLSYFEEDNMVPGLENIFDNIIAD